MLCSHRPWKGHNITAKMTLLFWQRPLLGTLRSHVSCTLIYYEYCHHRCAELCNRAHDKDMLCKAVDKWVLGGAQSPPNICICGYRIKHEVVLQFNIATRWNHSLCLNTDHQSSYNCLFNSICINVQHPQTKNIVYGLVVNVYMELKYQHGATHITKVFVKSVILLLLCT